MSQSGSSASMSFTSPAGDHERTVRRQYVINDRNGGFSLGTITINVVAP